MTPARFWDRAAPKYSQRPIGNMAAYEAGLARVRSHLTGSDRLPELGCGTAGTARRLAPLLPDPERDIARIRDLVKPGGLFISKTPCLTGLFGLLRPVIGAMRLAGRAPKVHFLSPARLDRAVTAAGFEIVETGNYPKSPPGHLIVARRV